MTGMLTTTLPNKAAKTRRLSLVLALIALASALAIEALHGHVCTGDGCMLCLVAAIAHVSLFASIGIAIASPIVRKLSGLPMLRTTVLPACEPHGLVIASPGPERTELTPVTMGVELII